jgi:hypothetical protein
MANGDTSHSQLGGKNLGNIRPQPTEDLDEVSDGSSSESFNDDCRPWATKSVPTSVAHCESPVSGSGSGGQYEDEGTEDENNESEDSVEGISNGSEVSEDEDEDEDLEDEDGTADGISHPIDVSFEPANHGCSRYDSSQL